MRVNLTEGWRGLQKIADRMAANGETVRWLTSLPPCLSKCWMSVCAGRFDLRADARIQ
jgi:hypothetical protein